MHEPVGLAAQLVLQHGEIRGAVCRRNDHFAVDDGTAGVDQVGVGRDLAEAPGPVVAAAGEDLDGIVMDVQLHAVAVELDLVDPAIAGWHFLDRRRQRGLDESGEGRLHADCRRLLALKRHTKLHATKADSGRTGPRTRVGMQGSMRSFGYGINRQPQTKCESDHISRRANCRRSRSSFRSTKSENVEGSSRICRSQRRRSSPATSSETSSDQRSAVLKATTRIGLLYRPVSSS